MHVTDYTGNIVTVSDLPKAIAQAQVFVGYTSITDMSEGAKYWRHMLKELKKLKPPTPKPVIAIKPAETEMEFLIRKIREERIGSPDTAKLFIKDTKPSPLYGAWSCVKIDRNLYKLDNMEIGETWIRFGSPNITRVF